MKSAKLSYSPKLYRRWRSKLLQKKWQRQYSNVFDKDDLRIALTQPSYHFGEWLVAIRYAKKGYGVLVEKYRSHKTHRRKYEILSDYFTPNEIRFLTKSKHQPPDLFIFKGRKFLFVEVKKDSDRLSSSQRRFFERIERRLRCKVYAYYLKPKTKSDF